MKTHTETPLAEKTQSLIHACVQDGLSFFGLTGEASPEVVVGAVDEYVYDWQRGGLPANRKFDPAEAPYLLGALWGQQLVRQFRWHWANITFHQHGDSMAPGVIAPDAALAVFPMHFLIGCLQDPSVDATIELSFTMLVAGKINCVKAGSYSNLMEGVRRIVPRS